MTLSQCKNRFCEKIDALWNWIHQPKGTSSDDEMGEAVYGFEDSVLALINQVGSEYLKEKVYEEGDIVVYGGDFYISRRDFNKGFTPSTSHYYWHKKFPVRAFMNGNVRAYALIRNGNLIFSKGIESVEMQNYGRADINLDGSFNSSAYATALGAQEYDADTGEKVNYSIYSQSSSQIRIQKHFNCSSSGSPYNENMNFELMIFNDHDLA